MTDHVLRIDCPDEKGLVYRVTGELFHAGYNIISNQEFVDSATANFFMRTTFAGPGTPSASRPICSASCPRRPPCG